MANKAISKNALWDQNLEALISLHQAELEDALGTYFYKTPNQIIFTKELPDHIKLKIIKSFFFIYAPEV